MLRLLKTRSLCSKVPTALFAYCHILHTVCFNLVDFLNSFSHKCARTVAKKILGSDFGELNGSQNGLTRPCHVAGSN